MTVEERLEYLLQSQESLGHNLEELHEILAEQGRRVRRHDQAFRAAMVGLRASLDAWLRDEDENPDAGKT